MATKYPHYEVIFVDNGSTDGSVVFVEKNYHVKLIKLSQNVGVSKGFNVGISSAKGKYVATLNNDIEVESNWLKPLILFMESNSKVVAVDCKYLDYYDRKRFDISSAGGRYLDFVANPLTREAYQLDLGQCDQISRVFYSCTLFKREAIIAAGLFDEDFFYGYEDADLGWRLNLNDGLVMYIPESIIYHKGTARLNRQFSTIKSADEKHIYYFNKRNKLIILLKNFSISTLIRILPIFLFEQIGYTIYWSFKLNKQNSLESIRATFWALKNFRKIWIKHLTVQRLRKINDNDILSLLQPYCGDPIKFLKR